MQKLKKYLGVVWMLLGPLTIFFLAYSAFSNIEPDGKSDISKPLPWLIIISIFTPVAFGLTIFGWYAWKGEYDTAVKNP